MLILMFLLGEQNWLRKFISCVLKKYENFLNFFPNSRPVLEKTVKYCCSCHLLPILCTEEF
ncbi:hypothetical protein T01_10747 [Trichinella spiralis]|uniref:Uncharacterized protein n=1 Tax=Trichinella spiralis TaxID=6334 RepID=A0A0V1AK12_TRISP|nr:hypothetical protein T01_10747 [Trichinella spiralis]